MRPLVSIVLPVYNCERYIRECIDSILAQTYNTWELVIIDDGSTDASPNICDEYAQSEARIKVFHQSNNGVSYSRNIGIEASSGQFIVFCDSDDYLEPEYLETLLQTARDHPSYEHIWCCFQTVSGSDRENARPNYVLHDPVSFYSVKDILTLHAMWLDASPCNKLFSAEKLMQNHLRFPEDLSLGEDYLFNLSYLDCSCKGKIAVISQPLYNYRRRKEDSLDTKYRSDLLEIYKHLNEQCRYYLKKWNISPSQWNLQYDNEFYMYEKVFRNNMRAPEKTKAEKIRWNSTLMRDNTFQTILKSRTCFVHPLYLWAYRSGNYYCVFLVDCLVKLKQFIVHCIHNSRKA